MFKVEWTSVQVYTLSFGPIKFAGDVPTVLLCFFMFLLFNVCSDLLPN